MAVALNKKALDHAKSLVRAGQVVHDERDNWSEHAPGTDEQNGYLHEHGYSDYSKWFLGIDETKPDETKGRYSFPFGDFSKIHRCAVISLESRAAQNDHDDITRASKDLLERIDKK